MPKILEGGKAKVEEVKPTPEVEGAKPTEPKVEPTVSITETPEFRQALDKALGKGLETTNRQLSMAQAEARTAKAEAEAAKAAVKAHEEAVATLEKKLEEDFDPERLKDYRLEMRERKAALREAQIEEAEARHKAERDGWLFATEMDAKMKELTKQYQVPKDILELATSLEQMEKIAKAFPEVGTEPKPEDKGPKFDLGISSGGRNWATATASEKVAEGMRREQKNNRRK